MKVTSRRDRVYNTQSGDIPGWEIAKEVRVCAPCAGETVIASAMARALGATPVVMVQD